MYNRAAQTLASQGRYGDNMLVHMNPQEVAGLAALARAHGGHISINPKTGLPEAFSLGDIFGRKGIVGNVFNAVGLGDVYGGISKGVSGALQGIAKFLSPLAPFAAFIPGIGLPLQIALAAGLGGLKDGKNWDAKRGIMSGLAAYGLGSLAAPAAAGAGAGEAAMATGPFDLAGAGTGVDAAAGLPGMAGEVSGPMLVDAGVTPAPSGVDVTSIPGGTTNAPTGPYDTGGSGFSYVPEPIDYAAEVGEAPFGNLGPARISEAVQTPGVGAGTPTRSFGEAAADLAGTVAESGINYAVNNPLKTAMYAYTGYTAYKTKEELDAAKEEAARILADQKNRRQRDIDWANQVMASYPTNLARLTAQDVEKYGIGTPTYAAGGVAYDDELGTDDVNAAQGGLMGLAKGGLPPRFLQGSGDGMSDSIPARIAGKQEARLADGEFVVPADVVSHLGNGSSKAGAQQLYTMMDRVRKARTGKTRQAPQIKAGGLMPA